MFSLIITIISIALVVALVAATMYHGGDVLSEGRSEADAAGLVAGAQQITGAAAMFLALEGEKAAGIGAAGDDATDNTLVGDGYLASVPSSVGTWGDLDDAATTDVKDLKATSVPTAVCEILAADNSDTYTCAAGTFTFKY